MSEKTHACPRCSRKIIPSVSNRCMYCGAELPEEHHLSQEEKARLLSDKMEQFRNNEENKDDLNRKLRKDFGVPEKKSRQSRKQENAHALAEAMASIKSVVDDQTSSPKSALNNSSDVPP